MSLSLRLNKTSAAPEQAGRMVNPPEPTAAGAASTNAGRARGRIDGRPIVLVSFAVGVLLRVLQYAANRSVWLDEALVVPAIVGRSVLELVNPATWGALPPGYLFLSRLATALFGASEYALRLVPLLAGIASLLLFLPLARRYTTRRAVPLAVGLFALSPFLIYYASDVKQYSSDALVTVLLLLLAYELRERGITTGRAAAWWAVGLVAAAFSMTALFVLLGVTVALLIENLAQRERRAALCLVGALGGWALAFGAPYLLFVSGTPANPYLQLFWRSGFMPLPPTSLAELAWFPATFARVFRDPLGVIDDATLQTGFYQAAAGMLAFTVGCAWMWSRKRALLGMLLAPVGVTLLASGFRVYPFGGAWVTEGRVLVFLVPVFLLVIAEGAVQLYRRLGAGLRLVGVAVIALLVLPPLAQAALAIPYGRSEIKPVLGYVQENWQPGDLLYVHYEVGHEFGYYAPRYGFDAGNAVLGPCARFEPVRYLNALAEHFGRPRLWVLVGSGVGALPEYEHALIKRFLDHFGTRVDDQVALGSAVYLYDLSRAADVTEQFRLHVPEMEYALEAGCALWGGD